MLLKMTTRYLTIVIGLSCLSVQIRAANILFLHHLPSPSHHLWNRNLMQAVASKGHNITMLSPDLETTAHPNMTFIHLENVYRTLFEDVKFDIMDFSEAANAMSVYQVHGFSIELCKIVCNSKGLDTIRSYPPEFRFDLIVIDSTAGPCMLFLWERFGKPPLVSVSAFSKPPFVESVMGGHKYYAYVPHQYLLYDHRKMSLFQKVNNFFLFTLDDVIREYYVIPKIDKMLRGFYPDLATMPYIGDLEKKTSIFLVNTDTSIDFPEPYQPNVIHIGGAQIKEPQKLPADMQKFIDSGKKGTVLFSLGTNLHAADLGKELLQKFLEAFRQMPNYNFLWKLNDAVDVSDHVPKNVLIQPWVPQTDVFAHPNIKAFMTHSGLLSTQEAAWFGIPMITIPFFMDQFRNSYKCTQSGVAEEIDFKTTSTENIRKTVLKVLENPKYKENIQIVSKRFRDQKEKPIERAVWWIEWAIRNPDASHLQSPAKTLGSFRANNYDVLLFTFLLVICTTIFLTRCLSTSKDAPSKRKIN